MSQQQLNQITKVYRISLKVIAAAIAIGALIKNPTHLFTAALLYGYADSVEFVNAEDFEL